MSCLVNGKSTTAAFDWNRREKVGDVEVDVYFGEDLDVEVGAANRGADLLPR